MVKILVIEDEEEIRENILELLDAEDFEAIGANNGSRGIQLAIKQIPDLIICDVMMSELDGYAVLAQLRQESATAAIPFIFLTALSEKKNLRQGMEMGADDYLTKPCTPDELLRAIATRLAKQTAIYQRYTTSSKQILKQINYCNDYDCLTKLPNRRLLQKHFNQTIGKDESIKSSDFSPLSLIEKNGNSNTEKIFSEIDKKRLIPVLCVNLDRFHWLNETLGYSGIEFLLKVVAERLVNVVGNQGIVACLSTEQFGMALTSNSQRIVAAHVAQNLLESFLQPFVVGSREVFMTASIGIALYPRDGWDIERLLQNANKAMNHAQQLGGNNYQFYTATFNLGSSDRLALETDLRYALEKQELQLHYQPQVNLLSGKIIGSEALLRWYHPDRGLISPAKFIPLAEETGLIESIGEWVLNTACQQTQEWNQRNSTSLRIAINLSSRQFNQLNLHQRLFEILVNTGLDPQCLELELTESIIMVNTSASIRQLNALRSLGIKIAIDDFGTGYSSLSYLQQFPCDVLKIDQCFVSNVSNNAKNAAIITAIIQMAYSLNLKVIAEGVETSSELAFLRQCQCHEIQGFLLSHPLTAAEFEKLLNSGKKLHI